MNGLNSTLDEEITGRLLASTGSQSLLDEIIAPDWTTDGWPLHWTQFVPGSLRDMWTTLGIEAKIAAFIVAEATKESASMKIN